ncbi:metal ABC transporter permease [Fibrobacterota bacterium]
MLEILHYEFIRNALLAGILVSIACGIVGTLVVVNRLSFLSGGIAHSAYGGLGLAAYLKWPPMAGAILFTSLASLLLGAVTMQKKERADTVIGVVWAVGMAFGIIMLDLTKGYHVDLMSYLFGSILAVSKGDLLLMLILDIIIIALVTSLYKEFLGISYDNEYVQISGVPVKLLYYILFILIALSVVMLIQIVGLILIIALFTIPAAIAEKCIKNLKGMMVLASALGVCFTIGGIILSYYLNFTAGAVIIMLAGISYLFVEIFFKVRKNRIAHR